METEIAFIYFGVLTVFALVIFAIVLIYQSKKKRREALAMFAFGNGFRFTQKDPFDLPGSYHFGLFSLGEGRACENVLEGSWRGRGLVEADYWYYTESSASEGSSSRSYRHFQVVLMPIPAFLPTVSVSPENFMTKVARHIGLSDINFESEEFNRRYNIKSKDRRFAFELIDARMIEWLLKKSGYSFETNGATLLLYSGKKKPNEIPGVLDSACELVERVPRLVWNEYRTGTAAETAE
jgi:hypothetical protein